MKKANFNPKKYLIVTCIGLAFCLVSIFVQGLDKLNTPAGWFHHLSNATLVPGILFLIIGLVIFISNEGGLSIVSYSAKSLIAHLKKKPKTYKTYYDYINRDKTHIECSIFIIPALIFIVISIIFAFLFNAL